MENEPQTGSLLQVPGSGNGKTAKFVIIGDGSVGKTCVCTVYSKKEFPKDYIPTVFENHSSKHIFDGEEISVSLWDTAGQEELKEIRVLSYGSTSVFLICFSLDRLESLNNLKATWLPEIQQREPKAPRLLVGTKSDLKNKSTKITQKDINKIVKEFKMSGYVECRRRKGYPEILRGKL
eukprot:GFUD01038376.1.p1 GENE.GFUD01038376.1~~GFUD01038376.1.p1  ORF type:complete len:179 (+),score=34.64 GFUD01038376.1:97-633(+)